MSVIDVLHFGSMVARRGTRLRGVKRSARALALAGALGLAGCGGDSDRVNRPRPAAAITVTAAILEDRVNVSPRRFGAGPIRLLVSNQTDAAHALTFETAGAASGITETTARIDPASTGTLEVDVPEGVSAISISSARSAW